MKKVFFTLFASFISLSSQAQIPNNLYGRWKISSNGTDESELVLKKINLPTEVVNRRDWGRFIEFSEDGTYHENASAPCGMDDNRYHYSGKWSFDSKIKKIELTQIKVDHARPNIYATYSVLSSGTLLVISVEKNSIVLKITKPWEKVSAKKNN